MRDQEMLLKRPDYISWTEDGRIAELYCKLCGTQVGGQVSRLVGKKIVDGAEVHEHILEFQRFPQYAEAKIEFRDGSHHVTLGCENCLRESLKPSTLDDIHQADLDASPSEFTGRYKSRKAKRMVGMKRGGGIR